MFCHFYLQGWSNICMFIQYQIKIWIDKLVWKYWYTCKLSERINCWPCFTSVYMFQMIPIFKSLNLIIHQVQVVSVNPVCGMWARLQSQLTTIVSFPTKSRWLLWALPPKKPRLHRNRTNLYIYSAERDIENLSIKLNWVILQFHSQLSFCPY